MDPIEPTMDVIECNQPDEFSSSGLCCRQNSDKPVVIACYNIENASVTVH